MSYVTMLYIMAEGGQSPDQTPVRENDPERIAATEVTKQRFKGLVEQLAEGGKIPRHGMSQHRTYDLEDGRQLTVTKRLPVDVGKLNPLERLVLPTEELAKVKLRREFNTGAREQEDYRLKPDLTFEREFEFLSPDDKPVSEMTEEEFEKFGKGLEEDLQHQALERKLGMRIVTEAEANNVNSLLQNVLSNPHKGNGGQ
jgi:hypothetical protein